MGFSTVGALARPVPVVPVAQAEASRGCLLARDAEAFLWEHLEHALTIADLCEALGTTARTLHAAFHDHLGTSPKAYQKALRLNAARHDLLQAEKGTRVTDVALRWGFLHFGWFSHDYHRHFGETPSGTLRSVRQGKAFAA